MTTAELVKKIGHTDAALTLYNDYGEAATASKVITLTQMNNKARIRWEIKNPVINISPFNHAIVHKGRTVWASFDIPPVLLEGAKEIEVNL